MSTATTNTPGTMNRTRNRLILPFHLPFGRLAATPRSRRVVALLTSIVLLSLVDLVITLAFMSSTGMFESNPLVAWLARGSGSALTIAQFKALSVLVGVSLLYRTRRSGSAELAAWLMTLALAIVAVRWMMYAGEVSGMDPDAFVALASFDSAWVRLD